MIINVCLYILRERERERDEPLSKMANIVSSFLKLVICSQMVAVPTNN